MIKSNYNQPATKGDIEKLRKEMATKEEFKAIRKEMATKKDFKELRGDFAKEITRLDIKIDKKVDGLQDNMTKWKDEILTSNDKLSKKLDIILTEQKSISENYKRVDRRLDNVEDYIEQADEKLGVGFEREVNLVHYD